MVFVRNLKLRMGKSKAFSDFIAQQQGNNFLGPSPIYAQASQDIFQGRNF